MKIVKQLNVTAITIVMALSISCNHTEEKKTEACLGSYELGGPNMRDTVNLKDCHGYKQGKWVPSLGNKLKDTVYYKNDTIVN